MGSTRLRPGPFQLLVRGCTTSIHSVCRCLRDRFDGSCGTHGQRAATRREHHLLPIPLRVGILPLPSKHGGPGERLSSQQVREVGDCGRGGVLGCIRRSAFRGVVRFGKEKGIGSLSIIAPVCMPGMAHVGEVVIGFVRSLAIRIQEKGGSRKREGNGQVLDAPESYRETSTVSYRRVDPVLINLFNAVSQALHSSQSVVVIPT